MKKCNSCGRTDKETSFYEYLNTQCKECYGVVQKRRMRAYRNENVMSDEALKQWNKEHPFQIERRSILDYV